MNELSQHQDSKSQEMQAFQDVWQAFVITGQSAKAGDPAKRTLDDPTTRQQAKATGDIRLLVCYLPSKSLWLNPIEPRWAHAKRQTLEPSPSPLPAHLLHLHLFQYFGTHPLLRCSTYHE